jgi:hypothetical protein
MGYIFDKDYVVKKQGETITLQWFHTDPKPSEQDITDIVNDVTMLPSGKTYTQSKEPAHVEINGIKMATDLQSQAAFSNMMTLLNEAGMADSEMVMIKDCFGASHAMTLASFRTQAVAYGLSCYQAFHAE